MKGELAFAWVPIRAEIGILFPIVWQKPACRQGSEMQVQKRKMAAGKEAIENTEYSFFSFKEKKAEKSG
jgi:hypothetical protein